MVCIRVPLIMCVGRLRLLSTSIIASTGFPSSQGEDFYGSSRNKDCVPHN